MRDSDIKELKVEEFPPLLKEIPEPPKKLYYRGVIPDWNNKFLCVVGSRKYSSYGKDACEKLIRGLAGYPIVIVSGLALGIDAIAHQSALLSGLTTLAIPGSGLGEKVLYPSQNRNLAKKIIEAGGCLLSEFEKDFRATQWSFPQRNRIMAGISHATLVIEAEAKSGTLITSRLATDYNRDVCTVPGSIFSKSSDGPHMLIRLGATPIRESADLLEVLGLKAKTESGIVNTRNYDGCSKEENEIIEIIKNPMSRDDLIRALGKPAREVNGLITILEIKGFIKENAGEIRLN